MNFFSLSWNWNFSERWRWEPNPGVFGLESAAVKLEILHFGGNLEAFSRIADGAGPRVFYLFLSISVLFIIFGFVFRGRA